MCAIVAVIVRKLMITSCHFTKTKDTLMYAAEYVVHHFIRFDIHLC